MPGQSNHYAPFNARPFIWAAIGAVAAVAVVRMVSKAAIHQRHPVGNPNVPKPSNPVDLDRYLGLWHEIARYEQSFERGCEAVTAAYARLPDDRISIVNACREPDGRLRSAHATAKVVPGTGNTQLKVSFFGPLYIGNYWVLDHAEDYTWSIVGDPSGRYLWLLHRDGKPAEGVTDDLVSRAAALGYDIAMLRFTQQTG